MMRKIVIIGNGISGITAARNIRKNSNDEIFVISSETDYFFSRTALMYVYMKHMKFKHTQPYENWFWDKNRIRLIKDYVEAVDSDKKELTLLDGGVFSYDVLIIACGSKPNKFGWPGQDLKGVQGLYSKQDLDSLEQRSGKIKQAVLVGGGLIGIELAEMLLARNIDVTFLVRESSFWSNVLPAEESALINGLIKHHNIKLLLNTELKEIKGNSLGEVKEIVTGTNETIPCQFVGLTAGVSPNIDFLKNSKIKTERGVIVNKYLETNIPDVYAIGDCAQQTAPDGERKPIEQVWYTGKIMGETVAQTITGNKKQYQPGIWFNSAKFFDLEYQTYGWVWSQLKQNEKSFFWKHEAKDLCLRIVYDKSSQAVLGFNVMGIRFKHEVCEAWIKNKTTIEEVIEQLPNAYFDPEFFGNYTRSIKNKFSLTKKAIHENTL